MPHPFARRMTRLLPTVLLVPAVAGAQSDRSHVQPVPPSARPELAVVAAGLSAASQDATVPDTAPDAARCRAACARE
jgi:hypothetical protein